MGERVNRVPEQDEQKVSEATAGELGKITVLEALATETIAIDQYSSNISTPHGNSEFDDQ